MDSYQRGDEVLIENGVHKPVKYVVVMRIRDDEYFVTKGQDTINELYLWRKK